jgi:uncharacterized protein
MAILSYSPQRLDVVAFAQDAAQLSGAVLLSKLERVSEQIQGSAKDLDACSISWQASGESIAVAGGAAQSWLHLKLEGQVPMQCQRCLQAMAQALQIERSFRFVASEAQANAEDDDSEEDLLVVSKQFDLMELLEDELIMALPFAPTHETCPTAVKLASSDDEYQAALSAKPHAFAALGALKLKP